MSGVLTGRTLVIVAPAVCALIDLAAALETGFWLFWLFTGALTVQFLYELSEPRP